MSTTFEYEMDGIKYIWNGKMWYEDEKYLELPVKITNKLDNLVNSSDKVINAPIQESMAAAKAALRAPTRRKKAAAAVIEED